MSMFCSNCGEGKSDTDLYCSECRSPLQYSGFPLKIDTIIQNRYKILKHIKSGGMGSVYKALDTTLHNICAVKELVPCPGNPQKQMDAEKWFKREAKILAGLDHANLPKVYDYFISNNRYYLVMNFIDGEDMESILEKEGKPGLPEEKVINCAMEVLKVLDYLHNQKPPIIYRDIKPSNIMLHKDGRTMLIDFGIARTVQQDSQSQKTAIGTLGYVSEEQCQGEPEPRSDIYSLGATMHHLLTGEKPIPFKFDPIRNLISGISPELENIVMKALNNKASKRYKSARAMLEALTIIKPERNRRNSGKIAQSLWRKHLIRNLAIAFLFFIILLITVVYKLSGLYTTPWKTIKSGTEKNLRSLYFTDLYNGWATGDNGTILHTEDGGQTWKPQSANVSAHLHGVYFENYLKGWIVGREWKEDKCEGVYLFTEDGGIKWEKKYCKNSVDFNHIDFIDLKNAWAVGEGGKVFFINSTNDFWEKKDCNISEKIEGLSFINPLKGWIVYQIKTGEIKPGVNKFSGRILRTEDGGNTWEGQNIDSLYNITAINFIDSNNGWIGGLENKEGFQLSWSILHTVDGGLTWNKQYSKDLLWIYKVKFIDARNGCFMGIGWKALLGLGMTFFYTTDGGITWVEKNSLIISINDFYFVDNSNGWAVGNKGMILKYNGGK